MNYGKIGELLAAQHLESLGYTIIERNFFVRGGEIDLICEHKGTRIFIEVKTRTQKEFGEGVEAVTKNKKRILKRAMQSYIELKREKNPFKKIATQLRFDVIDLELDLKNHCVKKLLHIINIEMR